MITRKIFPFVVAVFMILSFASSAQAEFFSVSAGIPVSHSLENSDLESDGVSGFLVHFKLPIMIGLGMEAYNTDIKFADPDVTDMKLATNMYDIFWMAPIPVINITIGAGFGTVELSCSVLGGTECSDYFEKGVVTQYWGQLGFSPLPLFDLHVSYHKTAGKVLGKDNSDDMEIDGTVMAVGASIIF